MKFLFLKISAGPGSWLVRPSDTTKGDYSIFFYCNRQIQRFKIQKCGRQYFMGGRYFDRLEWRLLSADFC